MRIRQLIFQGVCGYANPIQLDVRADVARETLPSGVTIDDTRALLINLLYPTQRSVQHRELLEQGGDVKLALRLDAEGETFRLARKRPQSSLGLQLVRETRSTKTLATGPDDVEQLLERRLGRPPLARFRALNLWSFEPVSEDEDDGPLELEEMDREARELLDQYRAALEFESLESRIDDIEVELERLRGEIREGLEAEKKLERAESELDQLEVTDLSEEDLELVENKDERLEELQHEYDRLSDDEENERRKLESLEPDPPWLDGPVWGGLLVGLAAIGASIWYHDNLRWIVLVDVVGFGFVTWSILKHLTDLESVNIHRVRIDSIKRRMSEVREKMVDIQERIDHLLVHADADDELELIEKYRRADELESLIDEQTDTVDSYRSDPNFVETKERIESLEAEREDLERQRDDLPDYVPDRYQIEMQFSSLGYDPEAVREAIEGHSSDEETNSSDEAPEDEMSPFEVLREIASDLGLWHNDELGGEPRRIWSKITGHLLGDAFQSVDLTDEGELEIADLTRRQLDRWMRTHPEEVEIASRALALSLHLGSAALDDRIETVWSSDPGETLAEERAAKFDSVLDNAASRAHFALLSEAS